MSLRSQASAPTAQHAAALAPGLPEPRPLELLAPARNRAFGMAAIDHGADAVYIGGPSFGARAAAGNSLADIEALAQHAHRFGAHVYVALNTILRDDELEEARRMAWQVWEAGADALIIQDMGLLEVDLPPIALHASTQVDNRSAEKVRFLEQVGFSQVVLARELSLAQIARIAQQTQVNLEFFIHGALCVSYSGQCYISHAHTGRSANRGECSQACRLPYSLADAEGSLIAEDKHLLSLKDNDQRDNLRELIAAGITSFKIEGRLKDLAYVKNVTAFYRQRLDALLDELPGYRRASDGRCTYSFVPQPEKTFNRGATDYFVRERQIDIAAIDTPKFAGEPAGEVLQAGRDHLDVGATPVFHNGDGLAFFDARGELTGLRVNRVESRATGQRLHFAERCDTPELNLKPGTPLFRNHDQAFLRALDKPSAERRIDVVLRFSETADGFALAIRDARGTAVEVHATHAKDAARNPERVLPAIHEQLGKLGGTMFSASAVEVDLSGMWFLPTSLLNGLRRDALAALEAARLKGHARPAPAPRAADPPLYPERELSYLGNVFNAKARAFYTRHGVELIADAYEANAEKGAVSLMITKHCLRYSYNLCPKQVKGIRPDPMTLVRGNDKLTLRFDCKRCEMHVIGKLRKSMPVTLVPRGH